MVGVNSIGITANGRSRMCVAVHATCSVLEEIRSRWDGRTSNPERAARRPFVGSTPTFFRHSHPCQTATDEHVGLHIEV